MIACEGVYLSHQRLQSPHMRQTTLVLLLVFGCWAPAFAQRNVQDSTVTSTHVAMTFGGYIPLGDLQDRFGSTAQLGVNLARKNKQGWYYGLNFGYHFGQDVTEPGLLQNLLNDEGHILANDGRIAEVNVGMRGYYLGLEGGRVFNVVGPNPNCGILVKGGAGYLHHKIRLEHQYHEITQLEDPYLQGYDRLTNGIAINQFVGYFHMSNNRRINFYLGVEAIQGWTQGRRELYFDTRQPGTASRFDGLLGVRGGWVVHFYKRPPREYFFD